MYDPVVGRWLDEDPAGFQAGDVNLYRYVRNRPTSATDPSGLLECDDRPNHPLNMKLVDSTDKVEGIINGIISRIARDTSRQPMRDVNTFLRNVYDALGADQRNTGITASTPFFNIASLSNVSRIAAILSSRLSWTSPQIVRVPFRSSRYGRTPLLNFANRDPALPFGWGAGPMAWRGLNNADAAICLGMGVPPAFTNIDTANHMIAPNIRVDGIVIGTDKLEHFFQQGYWYHVLTSKIANANVGIRTLFGEYMEGFTNVSGPWQTVFQGIGESFYGSGFKFGIFGTASTGVASRADLNANEDGFSFYEKLALAYRFWTTRVLPVNPGFPFPALFKFSDYRVAGWSETITGGNRYTGPGMIVDDTFFG